MARKEDSRYGGPTFKKKKKVFSFINLLSVDENKLLIFYQGVPSPILQKTDLFKVNGTYAI